MYQFHGWATVRESPAAECEEERIGGIVRELREHIAALNWDVGVLDLRTVNGDHQLWTSGMHNHAPGDRYSPVGVFKHVAQLAPGSFGLLYIWDDEDREGWRNEFQVYVMARGNVERRKDPFLSPCLPVIEDIEEFED